MNECCPFCHSPGRSIEQLLRLAEVSSYTSYSESMGKCETNVFTRENRPAQDAFVAAKLDAGRDGTHRYIPYDENQATRNLHFY